MKKMIVWVLALTMGMALCACGGEGAGMSKEEAYAQAVSYVESTGAAGGTLGEDTISLSCAALETKQFNEKYSSVLGVSETGDLVIGIRYRFSDYSAYIPVISHWDYWMTIPADGEGTMAFNGSYIAFDGQQGDMSEEQGIQTYRLEECAADMSFDMDVDHYSLDYMGNESNGKVKLYTTRTTEDIYWLERVLIEADAMLAESGVTLHDLGFAGLE